jgi:hypothetical protein
MYDLDKTQEWLNRTLQMGKTPAVRGGRSPEPHARRHTTMSVAATALVIVLGMLLASWTRPGIRAGGGPGVVEVAGSARVADIVPMVPSPGVAPAPATAWPAARRPVSNAPALGWTPLALDGNVAPPPGYTAPPAPVWLDGAPRRSR